MRRIQTWFSFSLIAPKPTSKTITRHWLRMSLQANQAARTIIALYYVSFIMKLAEKWDLFYQSQRFFYTLIESTGCMHSGDKTIHSQLATLSRSSQSLNTAHFSIWTLACPMDFWYVIHYLSQTGKQIESLRKLHSLNLPIKIFSLYADLVLAFLQYETLFFPLIYTLWSKFCLPEMAFTQAVIEESLQRGLIFEKCF